MWSKITTFFWFIVLYIYNHAVVVTNISVALLSPTSIRLSWNRIREPQIRVIDHVVYYREIGAGVDTEQSLNTSFTESSLEIGELIPERSYQFQVKVSADVDGEFFVGERSGFGRALRYRGKSIQVHEHMHWIGN